MDTRIWKRVQDNRNTAFKRFDEARIIAFDASWVAHAIAAHATGNAVILSMVTITELPSARENLFQDDQYYVKFVGNGYTVLRKRDDQKMTDIVSSAELARNALINLYPKQVA